MVNYVTLRDTRDEGGSRHLSASLKGDGTLIIEGQDLGPGVEGFFGSGLTEYEWAWPPTHAKEPCSCIRL